MNPTSNKRQNQAPGNPQDEAQSAASETSHSVILPPELVDKILKQVDFRTLIKSRLVNRQWCEISSRILHDRPEALLNFDFTKYERFSPQRDGKRRIKHFLKLSKRSKSKSKSKSESINRNRIWPFARFHLYSSTLNVFESKMWRKFLYTFQGTVIKSLTITTSNVQDLQSFVETLRDLLLCKFPHLEEFGLGILNFDGESEIPLFSTAESLPNSVQLPKMKKLHCENWLLLKFPGIAEDLLNAAVNLQEIEFYSFYQDFEPQNFELLYDFGKLDLVKTAELDGTFPLILPIPISEAENEKETEKEGPLLPTFKLSGLTLLTDSISRNPPGGWAEDSEFINSVFQSCKKSLRYLKMGPLGFLQGLQFPRFENIEQLDLDQSHPLDFYPLPQFFPRGISSLDNNVFPHVRSLTMEVHNWADAFPYEDTIPRLPQVKTATVSLGDTDTPADVIYKLVLMSPNIKMLKIQQNINGNGAHMNFLETGRAIWTYFKGLESLEIDIDADFIGNHPSAIDSCLSGISPENCQRLYELTAAKQALEKWGSAVKVPESEIVGAVKEHPSILDMKDLKYLIFHAYSRRTVLDGRDGFTQRLMWTLQEYVFKLMPQLKVGFRYSAPSNRLLFP